MSRPASAAEAEFRAREEMKGPARAPAPFAVARRTEAALNHRPRSTGKIEPVRIDDASVFLARFANGSLGNFEATR